MPEGQPAPPTRPPADPLWVDRGGAVRLLALSADGRSSSSWRIWTSRNHKDVYVAPRQLAGQVKVSLHASGSFQSGFVNEEVAVLWQRSDAGRHLDIWDRPPEFEPGWTRIFEVILPDAELRHLGEELGGHHYVGLPVGQGYAVHVYLLYVRLDRPGRVDLAFDWANLVAVMDLGDDDRIAVVAVPQEWGTEAAQVIETARQRALDGEPTLLRPPDCKELPSAGTRFIQHGIHALDGSRFVVDASATLA